jgi:hypothetical protein
MHWGRREGCADYMSLDWEQKWHLADVEMYSLAVACQHYWNREARQVVSVLVEKNAIAGVWPARP